MTRTTLDQDEQDILEAFEAGEFQSELSEVRRAVLAQAAEETCKKDKRINIRISSRDLEALQRRAFQEGLPYQSLVASVLHKYVSGGLKDMVTTKPLIRQK